VDLTQKKSAKKLDEFKKENRKDRYNRIRGGGMAEERCGGDYERKSRKTFCTNHKVEPSGDNMEDPLNLRAACPLSLWIGNLFNAIQTNGEVWGCGCMRGP